MSCCGKDLLSGHWGREFFIWKWLQGPCKYVTATVQPFLSYGESPLEKEANTHLVDWAWERKVGEKREREEGRDGEIGARVIMHLDPAPPLDI